MERISAGKFRANLKKYLDMMREGEKVEVRGILLARVEPDPIYYNNDCVVCGEGGEWRREELVYCDECLARKAGNAGLYEVMRKGMDRM